MICENCGHPPHEADLCYYDTVDDDGERRGRCPCEYPFRADLLDPPRTRYELKVIVEDDSPNVVALFRDDGGQTPFARALTDPTRWKGVGARKVLDAEGDDMIEMAYWPHQGHEGP